MIQMKGLFLIISIIIIILVIITYISINTIYKYGVVKTLQNIKYGSLYIIDESSDKIIVAIEKSDYPKATIYIRDQKTFFSEIAKRGDVGLGWCYTKNIWYTKDSEELVRFIDILAVNIRFITNKTRLNTSFNSNPKDDAKVVQHHYDVGNDFYASFLTDPLMAYSCGIWKKESDTLDDAQYNKVNIIIRKLNVNSNHTVLDIGCGWGKIAQYVAEKTGATVHGLTISNEQLNYINTHSKNIKAYYGHYTPNNNIKYDRIYSIGMFEHVRCINYDTFFERVYNIINENGRFVLHTITTQYNDTMCKTGSTKNFLTEYIFPGGQIPKTEWILDAALKVGFKVVHIETFGGQHYAKTLRAWRNNLLNSRKNLIEKGYTEEHIKAYEYYMAECESAFFADHMQTSHFVFDKVIDNRAIKSDIVV